MEEENQTGGVYFHFQPFSTDPAVVPLIFVALLLLYLGSLVGNMSIGLTIWWDPSPYPDGLPLCPGHAGGWLLYQHRSPDSG